jgi:hypothetical protein
VHDATIPQLLTAFTITNAASNNRVYVAEEAIWNNTFLPTLTGKNK